MGRDLHDSVNQSIHSLLLFSDTLSSLLEKKETERAIHVTKRIQESGRQALKEIRLLLYDTQSPLADENTDLRSLLEERLEMVERRVGIKAEIISLNDAIVRYPTAWNENLYWMAIEALNNSLKHAQARRVTISFSWNEDELTLKIEDNGIGFDVNNMPLGGFGMRTMRERAELLGGDLSIKSSPEKGSCVSFRIRIEE